MLLSNVLILQEKEPHLELLQSAALWRADPQRENEKLPTAISAHSRLCVNQSLLLSAFVLLPHAQHIYHSLFM